MATANFADFYVRRQLFAPADAQQTLRNIAASGLLVRLGIGSDLITITASVILAVALYLILKPINRSVALVALFWWLLECAIAAVVTLNSSAALFLLNGKDSLLAVNTDHLETLAQLFVNADRAGNRISSVLFFNRSRTTTAGAETEMTMQSARPKARPGHEVTVPLS